MNIDFSHHAYCFEGDFSNIKELLLGELEKMGIETRGNPDLLAISYETFGIDDGRKIIDFQIKSAVGGDKKIIILEIANITVEAQNSLLKTLEEPTEGTHFFIIIPSSEVLLPTLRSRLQVQEIFGDTNFNEAEEFISVSKKKKLEIAKEIGEEKNRTRAIKLVNGLENIFHKKINMEKADKEIKTFLKALIKSRGFLSDRSPSIKMILEHIALITPRI